MVGLGGNNGTTLAGGIIANRGKSAFSADTYTSRLTFLLLEGITWKTKFGVRTPNYYGSITQASTVRIGEDQNGEEIYVPFNSILPMVCFFFYNFLNEILQLV